MADDIKFVEGLWIDDAKEAPAFVKMKLGFNMDKFIEWLKDQTPTESGYVNVDVLESKNGKIYAKLNDWKPKSDSSPF